MSRQTSMQSSRHSLLLSDQSMFISNIFGKTVGLTDRPDQLSELTRLLTGHQYVSQSVSPVCVPSCTVSCLIEDLAMLSVPSAPNMRTAFWAFRSPLAGVSTKSITCS